MSARARKHPSKCWKSRSAIGLAIAGIAALLVSKAPREVEPMPVREPAGQLIMGVLKGNLPYQDMVEGEPKGKEVELFATAARRMAIPVRYVGGSESELLTKLQTGEIDGLVGTTYEPGKAAAFFHYLKPYGQSEITAVVPANSTAETIWDLRGKDILTVSGSEGEAFALNFGLSSNLRRLTDLQACFNEVRRTGIYSGVICDLEMAELALSANSEGLKILAGHPSTPRGPLLAAGLEDYARDLEEGAKLAEWHKSGSGSARGIANVSSALNGISPERLKASVLKWLPFAIAALFALGFVLILSVNRRVTRRARFLISELEEQVRQAEKAQQDLALDKSKYRRNRRSVLN